MCIQVAVNDRHSLDLTGLELLVKEEFFKARKQCLLSLSWRVMYAMYVITLIYAIHMA
jgi:hypothetical protein